MTTVASERRDSRNRSTPRCSCCVHHVVDGGRSGAERDNDRHVARIELHRQRDEIHVLHSPRNTHLPCVGNENSAPRVSKEAGREGESATAIGVPEWLNTEQKLAKQK